MGSTVKQFLDILTVLNNFFGRTATGLTRSVLKKCCRTHKGVIATVSWYIIFSTIFFYAEKKYCYSRIQCNSRNLPSIYRKLKDFCITKQNFITDDIKIICHIRMVNDGQITPQGVNINQTYGKRL